MTLTKRQKKIEAIGDKFIETYSDLTAEQILALPSQEKNFIYSILRDVGYFTDPVRAKARDEAEAQAKADALEAEKAQKENATPKFGGEKMDSASLPFQAAS